MAKRASFRQTRRCKSERNKRDIDSPADLKQVELYKTAPDDVEILKRVFNPPTLSNAFRKRLKTQGSCYAFRALRRIWPETWIIQEITEAIQRESGKKTWWFVTGTRFETKMKHMESNGI